MVRPKAFWWVWGGLALGVVSATACHGGAHPTFVVTVGGDGGDAVENGVCEVTPGWGDCSLRAALDEANALVGGDSATIVLATDVVLASVGAGEDTNATGDLDVLHSVSVEGAGHSVDAAGLDRVFDVKAGSLDLSAIEVTGGDAAGGSGGGVRADAPLTVIGSTIHANQASSGGGISATSPATVLLSTLSGNGGGGIAATGSLSAASSTITDNEGGGISATGPSPQLRGVLLADQRSGADCAGTVPTSSGFNLDGDGSCGLGQPSDQSAIGDPVLTTLQPFGGNHLPVHTPAPGSPAVDVGDPSQPYDQRGFAVIEADVGALDADSGDIRVNSNGESRCYRASRTHDRE